MSSIDEVEFWQACVDLYSRARRLKLYCELFKVGIKVYLGGELIGSAGRFQVLTDYQDIRVQGS